MVVNKNILFSKLLKRFLEINSDVEAVIISDDEGLIIAGEKRKDIDLELVSFLTAIVNPTLDKIRNEFEFKKFGTASFDTEDHRLLFISIDENTTLSLVVLALGSIDSIAPYAYLLAEKTAQILLEEKIDDVQLTLPNLSYQTSQAEVENYLKGQIYRRDAEIPGDFHFKFIIIGDHRVGKTSIVRRFVEKRFQADYRSTIGLNVLTHTFESFNNKISVNLWDIGAQEYFKRFRKTYYSGAQAVFIVFDLTKRESFDNVTKWYNELMEFVHNKDLPIILVGNKKDLEGQREISFEEGAKLAKDLSELALFSEKSDLTPYSDLSHLPEGTKTRISFITTSALTGENVQEAFSLISYHFIEVYKELEKKRLREEVLKYINLIIEDKDVLNLTFINKDPSFSPGFQLLTELFPITKDAKVKDKKNKKVVQYPFGLTLENNDYESFKLSDSDGVLCIFDARESQNVEEWREIINSIFKKLKKNKVVSIGFRTSSSEVFSNLLNRLEIDQEEQEREFSIFIFQIGENLKMKIFNQIQIMIETLKNLLFSY